MKKYFKCSSPLLLLGFGLFFLLSCEAGSDDIDLSEPEMMIPLDLTFNILIVGADESSPYGDGTGVIKCFANAANAKRYKFKFGDGTIVTNTTGSVEYAYTRGEVNQYLVQIYAYSKTNDFVKASEQISILVQHRPFDDLIFSDEFSTNGSPDSSKWGYDLGTGTNGWGNGEKQYYTRRLENVKVEDGYLQITARKEDYGGSAYTSARVLTEGKFDFTYGKVEVRAKLPSGKGTWPAIWMLGSNFRTVGWPACGEIDIMEHWGHDQGTVQSALHTPSSSGTTVNHGSQVLDDVSTAFHVYSVEWDDQEIVFSVDGVVHYIYKPAGKNRETWPFGTRQFLILNVAMGASWFTIDPDFESSTMQVDYVRVYQ